MEEKIEQEKREIAVLTENILYPRIITLDKDNSLKEEIKNEIKNAEIDVFVQECVKQYAEISSEQIREHVMFVLNRTIENIKRLKENDGR